MSQPRDDWDDDERDALDGLEGELAEIRRRHAADPSLAMLRAADGDALPPDEQAHVERHLQGSPWSRALVEGLREAGADDRLDAASEQRLFDRITREARAASPRPQWRPAMIYSGLAVAATLIIAVMIRENVSAPDAPPAAPGGAQAPAVPPAAAPSAPVRIAFSKPDVKLSASALTWRGDPSANPFLKDVAPAFDAYRAGDYAKAVAVFDRLTTVYPGAIEVRFYLGVSRLLSGDDAGAIAPLEAASRIGNATFADDVSWYLAVAQQRAGRPEARERLTALCGGRTPHAAAACEALTQLGAAHPPPQGR